MSALIQQIVTLIEVALNKPAASLDTDAAMDLTEGWDSLKTMEIMIAVEKHFNTMFSARQMMMLDSAQAFRDALLQNGIQDS